MNNQGNFTEKGLLNANKTTIKVYIQGNEVEMLLTDFLKTTTDAVPEPVVPTPPVIEGNFTLNRTFSSSEIATFGNGKILLPKIEGYKYIVTGGSASTSAGTPFTGAVNIDIIQDVVPVNSGTATWGIGSMLGNANTGSTPLNNYAPNPNVSSNVAIYADAGGSQAPFANPSGAGTISLTLVLNYTITKL